MVVIFASIIVQIRIAKNAISNTIKLMHVLNANLGGMGSIVLINVMLTAKKTRAL